MNKGKLVQLEQIFRTFVMPLMDENGMHDFDLVWEFERYLISKKDEIESTDKQVVRKWESPLQSK